MCRRRRPLVGQVAHAAARALSRALNERALDEPPQRALTVCASAAAGRVEPKADTLLVFRSDRILHKVSKVRPTAKAPRVALTCHFLGLYE